MENEEELIGYKVCLFDSNFLVLVSATFNKDIWYKFNVWVSKKFLCGPLAIFGNIEDSKEWVKKLGFPRHFKIIKCKYFKSKETYLYHKTYSIRMHIDDAPKGTILADKVMLLEEIKI